MKEIKREKISSKRTIHNIEKYEINYGIILIINKTNGIIKSQTMQLDGRRISLVKPEFFDYIKTINPFHSTDYNKKGNYKWVDDYVIEDILSLTELNPNNLVELKTADHTIRDLDGKLLSTVINIDDSIFTNAEYDLKKVLIHLNNHPFIINSNLEISEAPYYQESYDMHIKNVKIYLPQNIVDSLIKTYGTDKFRDLFFWTMSVQNHNVLDTNQFLLKKINAIELLKDMSDDEIEAIKNHLIK